MTLNREELPLLRRGVFLALQHGKICSLDKAEMQMLQ